MNEKVLQTLEYTKIIDSLIEKATSQPGREMCQALVPMTDLGEIELAQTQTADALTMLFRKGSTSFGGNQNVTYAVRSLEIGSTLSAAELLKIAGLLDNVNRIKAYGRSLRDEEQETSLTGYFDALEPLTFLAGEIRRCILSEEEIADDASSTLKHIRRSIAVTGEKIHSQLNSMVNGSYRNYLQDAVITMRNDRYCIPVKAEYKGQVSGMIHDQSSSGSTYFIEPAVIVEMNNKLKELAIQEKEEIEIILATLSASAGEHTRELAENQRIMTFLDFTFAKASLAL